MDLQGAHVTAYQPRGSPPVLFLSQASRFAPGTPIRGGIPIAYPWFGRRADDPGAPLHGLARLVSVAFEEALHTYLAVGDVRRVTLTGLEDAAYLDETDGFARKRGGTAPLAIRDETDRIYDDTVAACVVWDPLNARRLEVVKTGSTATVVWSPGPIRARALPDLGDEEWLAFLCVESGNVGRAAVTVAAGARHRLTVALRSTPWHAA